jgi:hypothetical protein
VGVLHTGERGGVTTVVCNLFGAADTDAFVIEFPDRPIKPRTSDRMLATALSSLPCGAVILGIGGRPEEFMDDKHFDGSKVRVFGG